MADASRRSRRNSGSPSQKSCGSARSASLSWLEAIAEDWPDTVAQSLLAGVEGPQEQPAQVLAILVGNAHQGQPSGGQAQVVGGPHQLKKAERPLDGPLAGGQSPLYQVERVQLL